MNIKFQEEIPARGQVLSVVQVEHKQWADHNFPTRQSWMPLMGLIEEVGEFISSIDQDELFDAIGDCCIYLSDYCSQMGYNLQELYDISVPHQGYGMHSATFILKELGKLSHAHLKEAQQIRMTENHRENAQKAIIEILGVMKVFGDIMDIEIVVWKTWEEVRKRDWQKNKNAAHLKENQ